jgi:ferredoxin-type protein NapH
MKITANAVRILFLVLFLALIIQGKMMLWLALFGISLILALFFGRVYCGYVCPMNTLMIPTEALSKKMKLQKVHAPKWLQSGWFAWFALIGSIAVVIIFQRVLHKSIPILPLWMVVSVLVTLRYHPTIFHNYICFFGPLQKIFGGFAFFSKRVSDLACIGCKKCEKPCPSGAIVVNEDNRKAAINTALCYQCYTCKQMCPTNAISYGKKSKKADSRQTI